MVGRWIDSWLVPGNQINRRDVTSFYVADETCFFEWTFACTVAGTVSECEGASIVRLQAGNIVFMREYAVTAPRYEWEG